MTKRSESLFLLLIGVAGFVACIIPALLRPEHFPSDDSFFYLQVASNIFAGFGPTFNRITMTNGFHPLWQFCCAGVFFFSGGNKDMALLIICIVQQLMFLGIVYYLFLLNGLLKLRYWYLSAPILMFFFLSTGLYASEAHLHCLLLLMLTYYFSREVLSPTDSTIRWMTIGILSGLLFLARLDGIFILLAIAGIAGWKITHSIGGRRYQLLLAAAVPAIMLAVPYLAYNYFSFGHFVPISGAIKSTFPRIVANVDAIKGIGDFATAAAIVGLIVGAFSGLNKGRRTIFIVLSAGSILLAGYLIFFTDGNTRWPWYYISGIIVISLLTALFFEFAAGVIFRNRANNKTAIALIIYTCLLAFASFRAWEKYSNGDSHGQLLFQSAAKTDKKWQIEIALWLKDNLPRHTNIFVYDWPGMIAYYSDMNILSTDGLISDYAYNDALKQEGISTFLRKKNVHYWLGQTRDHPDETLTYGNKLNPDGSQTVMVNIPLYRTPAGSFILTNDNLVVDFNKAISNPLLPDLGLWRIEP